MRLDPSSATNNANYEVDTITTKRVKRQIRRILHPITRFRVVYSAPNSSVTLTFTGKQTFRTGGEITVIGGTSVGVVSASGSPLAGNSVFTISPGGGSIGAR